MLQLNLNINIPIVTSVHISFIESFIVCLIICILLGHSFYINKITTDHIKVYTRIIYNFIFKLKNVFVIIYHFLINIIFYFITINIIVYALDLILDFENRIAIIMISSVIAITIIHLYKCYINNKRVYIYDIFIKISILLICLSINLVLGIYYSNLFNPGNVEIHFLSSIVFSNIINSMELNKILYYLFDIIISYTTALFSINGKYILLPSYWEEHIICRFENPNNLEGSSTQNLTQIGQTGQTTSGLFPPADNNLSNRMLAQQCFDVLNHIETSKFAYAKEVKYLITEYSSRKPQITEIHMLDVVCSYSEYAQWDANLSVRHPNRFFGQYKTEEILTQKLNKDPKLRDYIIETTNIANRKASILLSFMGKLYEGEESIHRLTKSDSLQDKKTALVKLHESSEILKQLPLFDRHHTRSINIRNQMASTEKLLNLQENSLMDKLKENGNYSSVFENRTIPSIMGRHFKFPSAYSYLERQYRN